jgi:hypothetical protein
LGLLAYQKSGKVDTKLDTKEVSALFTSVQLEGSALTN